MSDLVRAVGALAGLAAVAGLVVLGVLYVAHAREVRRLRAWAGHAPERARPPRRRRSARRAISPAGVAVVLAGLLAGGAAAYGLNRGDGADPKPTAVAVRPKDVTVAVLNATTVPGLAASLRDRLAAAGFATGTIDVAADQGRADSEVQYAPGHRAAATLVARRFGIRRRAAASADDRARADGAPVIVIAGADRAP
jgi:hypothetical protein